MEFKPKIKNKGQKLWGRAKSIIPGGNMLLSKRAEMFIPDLWPSYFSKARGYKVWDLDNKLFLDMSIMGVGTNTLGYGNKFVDKQVIKFVNKGNMSTLNCPEEVYLAEKLIELHPWSEMVRFARTGGEANSIAIRIARAASGKEKVAICGYHGWHDWYLATNLEGNDKLKQHLLDGLNPCGVPKNLKGSVIPFEYGNFQQVQTIIKENDIGIIKMEVSRTTNPDVNFLKSIREICDKKGIILIFDECTSGFRETFGGIHLKFGVDPDMAIFGKALGNGYAITSVIGKAKIMEAAQSTFISSTFWTERIGSVAGLATLEVMKKEKSWEKISEIGLKVKNGWIDLFKKYDLKCSYGGIRPLPFFVFKSKNNLIYKTFITKEMLKKGFLASNVFYASTVHSDKLIKSYFKALEEPIKIISECEDGKDINELNINNICHSGFKRLN